MDTLSEAKDITPAFSHQAAEKEEASSSADRRGESAKANPTAADVPSPDWQAYYEKWPSVNNLGGDLEPEVGPRIAFNLNATEIGTQTSFPTAFT